MERAILEREKLPGFIVAGNATFTLVNTLTGGRFTYKVRQCEDNENLFFVKVLTGQDNTSDYTYLGTIFREPRGLAYKHGRKSRISDSAKSAVAFTWFMSRVPSLLPEALEVWHEGRCGRCGRALTVPESVAQGYGPECVGKM